MLRNFVIRGRGLSAARDYHTALEDGYCPYLVLIYITATVTCGIIFFYKKMTASVISTNQS